MTSEVLLPEICLGTKVYRDIRADEPEDTYEFTTKAPMLKVPFLDGDGVYIGNLITVHPNLSPLHFHLAQSIFGKWARGITAKELTAELISRGLAIPTVYSYTPSASMDPAQIFIADGALKNFLEGTA